MYTNNNTIYYTTQYMCIVSGILRATRTPEKWA